MSIRVETRRHPVDLQTRETVVIPYRRQRLSKLIDRYMSEFNGVTVWINSMPIAEDLIPEYRCVNGDHIVMAPKVSGPVTGVAYFSAQWWGITALSLTASIGVGMALSYGIAALTGKPPERPSTPGVKPDYAWSEGTTATDGIPMPLAFGRVPMSGNIISSYTDYDGDDEIRYMLLSHGFGNYEGPVADSMTINGQPAASYASSITTETKYGRHDQTAPTAFSSHRNELWINRPITNSGGALEFTTKGSDFDSLALLFEYQSRYIADDGGYYSQPLGIKIEIKAVGGAYSTLAEYNLSNSTDAVKKIKFLNTGSYTGGSPVAVSDGTAYVIKVTKTTADSSDSRLLNTLKFKYIHEVITTGFTYPGQPMTAISAVGTEEVSGRIDVRETWDTSIVNKVDTTIDYSNNPADIIHFLLTLPLITGAGTGPDPYVVDSYRGQDPATISNYAALLADLVTLHTRCAEPVSTAEGGTTNRYEFNGVFANSTDQWEAIKVVCAACDCSLVPRGNGYKLLIHENWTGDPVALYSPGNMIEGSFVEEEISNLNKKSKFEMSILDANADFAETLVPLYDSSAGHAAKIESVNGTGITNRTQAARKLKRMANYNVGVTHRRKFSVGLDGLSCEELDVVYAIPPEKDGGRVSSYSGGTPTVVTLDKKPIESGDDKLVLRTHNSGTGYDLTQVMTVLSVDGYDVTCTATPTVAPVADQTVWAFGPSSEVNSEWRVISITERNDDKAGLVHDIVTETNYDTEEADGWDPEISFNYNAYSIAQRINNVPTFVDINAPVPPSSFSPYYDLPFATNRTITGDGIDTVTWAKVDAAKDLGMSYRGTLSAVTPGSTTDKYIYWDPDAPTVYSTTNTQATAEAGNNYIIAINEEGTMYLYDSQAQSAITQHEAAINFDTRNDRDGSAVTAPTIAGDNTAVTHFSADDGSCNVVFKWSWAGSEPDIDGFQVITRQSTNSASYVIGTTADEERTYTLPADQRATSIFGMPINQYITFGVKAYRIVDPDVNANGIIESAVIQPAAVLEDPYQPATNVGGSYTDALIVSPLIKTATSGQRIQMDSNGMVFYTAQTAVGIYGTTGSGGSNITYGTTGAGGDNVTYGTGVLMYLYNFNNGIPIDISLEQTVADMHMVNRASNPSGAARVGDLAVVSGALKICTAAGTPGTWAAV